MDERVQG
jgi:hypothetical protein